MGKGILLPSGSSVIAGLDATPGDVIDGVKFVGAGRIRETGTIPVVGTREWVPGTADQQILGGRYLSGTQVIKGDANLIAANIKKGVTIFGIEGTWQGYVSEPSDIYYAGDASILNTNNARDIYYNGGNYGIVYERDNIYIRFYLDQTESNYTYYEFATTEPIDLSKYSKLIIEGSGFSDYANRIRDQYKITISDNPYTVSPSNTTIDHSIIANNNDDVVLCEFAASVSTSKITYSFNRTETKYIRFRVVSGYYGNGMYFSSARITRIRLE